MADITTSLTVCGLGKYIMGDWMKYCRLTQLNCFFYVIEIKRRPLALALATPLPHLCPASKPRVMACPWDLSYLMLGNSNIQCVGRVQHHPKSFVSSCKLCVNRSTLTSAESSKVRTTLNEHGGEAGEHGCTSQWWVFRHRNCNCAWVLWLVYLLVMQETQFDF